MSKFLKLLEQVDPQNTDKQEMIHKLAELFNLISSVEVSSDGDSITVSVGSTPIKLAIVDETDEEEAEDPAYSIDTAVQGLANKPTIGGKFNPFTKAGEAKRAVDQREKTAQKAIKAYKDITKNLEQAINNFDSSTAGFNVTR